MSSAENSAAPKPLSDKDIHVLAHAFSCMKTQPDVRFPLSFQLCKHITSTFFRKDSFLWFHLNEQYVKANNESTDRL